MKLEKLKRLAEVKGFDVSIIDFNIEKECGWLLNNHIYVNNNQNVGEDRIVYTLAHEIAHGYLHKDKGNTVDSPKHAEYEEQADRAAHMILDLLSMDFNTCIGGDN
ncbi:ImmA/IrrE family metallo-endopeptidase [uncultured Clostridium sp.]|uniref:ImmA/IrrE family metallo-endopeptidase n=1 Tax=uncultured Clostridium sp. TaxID=59620 RepID=UPI0025E19E16|nr:ImmA/IrrE family metallo-endopeptidase [uncultured Clostridium sp.]